MTNKLSFEEYEQLEKELWNREANKYIEIEEWDRAAEAYEHIGDLDKSNEYWIKYAEQCAAKKEWKEAGEAYAKIGNIQLAKTFFDLEGQRCYDNKWWYQAARFFEKSNNTKKNKECWIKHAEHSFQTDDFRAASARYEKAEEFDKSIESIEVYIKENKKKNRWDNVAIGTRILKELEHKKENPISGIEDKAKKLEEAKDWEEAYRYWSHLALQFINNEKWESGIKACEKAMSINLLRNTRIVMHHNKSFEEIRLEHNFPDHDD